MADRGGGEEVYLTSFPEPVDIIPVSGGRARHPRWNPRGGELFYVAGPPRGADPNSHRELHAVEVDTEGSGALGQQHRLFDASDLGFGLTTRGGRSYDIGPGGDRIILRTSGEEGTPTITIIDDVRAWMEALAGSTTGSGRRP